MLKPWKYFEDEFIAGFAEAAAEAKSPYTIRGDFDQYTLICMPWTEPSTFCDFFDPSLSPYKMGWNYFEKNRERIHELFSRPCFAPYRELDAENRDFYSR